MLFRSMASMQSVLEASLIRSIDRDAGVRSDVWSEQFTKQQFARFVLGNVMMLLKSKAPVEDLDFLIAIIKTVIY